MGLASFKVTVFYAVVKHQLLLFVNHPRPQQCLLKKITFEICLFDEGDPDAVQREDLEDLPGRYQAYPPALLFFSFSFKIKAQSSGEPQTKLDV